MLFSVIFFRPKKRWPDTKWLILSLKAAFWVSGRNDPRLPFSRMPTV